MNLVLKILGATCLIVFPASAQDLDSQRVVKIATPLLIDLNQNGKPDLLTGEGWGFLRIPSRNPDHYRLFAFEPDQEPALWEWIQGKDGLLVWDPERTGQVKDATQLFGTHTFGKHWNHGFEPLASLDVNQDGVLNGKELDSLSVWQDKNMDAITQGGEVIPVVDWDITEIKVKPTQDDTGVWLEKAVQQGSQQITMWDWLSLSETILDPTTLIGKLTWTNQKPERLELDVSHMKPFEMAEGGNLLVYKSGGSIWVRAQAEVDGKKVDFVFPGYILGDRLTWGDRAGGIMNVLLPTGDNFAGITITTDEMYATWSAELVEGNLTKLWITQPTPLKTGKEEANPSQTPASPSENSGDSQD